VVIYFESISFGFYDIIIIYYIKLDYPLKRRQSHRISHFQAEPANEITNEITTKLKNKINADNLRFICVYLRESAV
jgi:hypothetical protein